MDIVNGRGGEIFRWIKAFGRQIVGGKESITIISIVSTYVFRTLYRIPFSRTLMQKVQCIISSRF